MSKKALESVSQLAEYSYSVFANAGLSLLASSTMSTSFRDMAPRNSVPFRTWTMPIL